MAISFSLLSLSAQTRNTFSRSFSFLFTNNSRLSFSLTNSISVFQSFITNKHFPRFLFFLITNTIIFSLLTTTNTNFFTLSTLQTLSSHPFCLTSQTQFTYLPLSTLQSQLSLFLPSHTSQFPSLSNLIHYK